MDPELRGHISLTESINVYLAKHVAGDSACYNSLEPWFRATTCRSGDNLLRGDMWTQEDRTFSRASSMRRTQ